jgi:hypothetical protein
MKPPVAASENALLLSAMSVKFIDTQLDCIEYRGFSDRR